MKKIGKTKKCNWCDKIKSIKKGYLLTKQFFICDNCNLIKDIV